MSDIIESMAKAICCPDGRCCRADPDPRYSFQFPCHADQHKAEATAAYAAALVHLEKPSEYRESHTKTTSTGTETPFTAMIRAAK